MKKISWMPVLLLTPFCLIMAIFLLGLVGGILQGFGYVPAFGLRNFTPDYFISLLTDRGIWASIGISLYVALASAATATTLAVGLSAALVSLKKEHSLLYTVIKIPIFTPWVVTGLLMIHLLSGSGWLARLFERFGLERGAAAISGVLHSPGQLGTIFAFIWACTPFACFLIQPVMSFVTDTLGEAAANLGASPFQRLCNITLPLCGSTIRSTFLILLLSCFGSYEIPALLGMTAPRALPVEIYSLYNHYDLRHRPFAMALNTLMLVLALAMAALVACLGRRKQPKKENPL